MDDRCEYLVEIDSRDLEKSLCYESCLVFDNSTGFIPFETENPFAANRFSIGRVVLDKIGFECMQLHNLMIHGSFPFWPVWT